MYSIARMQWTRVRRLVGLLRTMIKHTDTHVITEDCDAFGLPAA